MAAVTLTPTPDGGTELVQGSREAGAGNEVPIIRDKPEVERTSRP